jgi:ribosomal protein S12 methylthiotransferase accessory factor
MSLRASFPGGKRVDAEIGGHLVRTDQPVASGGGGSAPEPFALFLASLGTCAGIYVLGFCQARGIPAEGIEIVQHHGFDLVTHRLDSVRIEVRLPPSFPEKYRAAVVQAAQGCAVKKALADPPEIVVTAVEALPGSAPATPAMR